MERRSEIAQALVRLGFLSSDAASRGNPAVDVLVELLPEESEIGVCLTCLGVNSNGRYECRERGGTFKAMTVSRQDLPYTIGDHVHRIERAEIVLCTQDELAWTASRYEGAGWDKVILFSIPFTDILGSAVHARKQDVVDVWLDAGPTVSIRTRPHEAVGLCEWIERAAASD